MVAATRSTRKRKAPGTSATSKTPAAGKGASAKKPAARSRKKKAETDDTETARRPAGWSELGGLGGLTLGLLLLLSLISYHPDDFETTGELNNWIGSVGHFSAAALVTLVGGLALPGLVLALVGLVRFLAGYRPRPRALRIAGAVLLASALSALVDIALSPVSFRGADLPAAGWLGSSLAGALTSIVAGPGAVILLLTVGFVAVHWACGWPLGRTMQRVGNEAMEGLGRVGRWSSEGAQKVGEGARGRGAVWWSRWLQAREERQAARVEARRARKEERAAEAAQRAAERVQEEELAAREEELAAGEEEPAVPDSSDLSDEDDAGVAAMEDAVQRPTPPASEPASQRPSWEEEMTLWTEADRRAPVPPPPASIAPSRPAQVAPQSPARKADVAAAPGPAIRPASAMPVPPPAPTPEPVISPPPISRPELDEIERIPAFKRRGGLAAPDFVDVEPELEESAEERRGPVLDAPSIISREPAAPSWGGEEAWDDPPLAGRRPLGAAVPAPALSVEAPAPEQGAARPNTAQDTPAATERDPDPGVSESTGPRIVPRAALSTSQPLRAVDPPVTPPAYVDPDEVPPEPPRAAPAVPMPASPAAPVTVGAAATSPVGVEIVPPRPRAPQRASVRHVRPGHYRYPSLTLLNEPTDQGIRYDPAELRMKAKLLESKLADYKVAGTVREIHPGPVVTMFEFVPAPGIKVSKIAGLADDLSMVLRSVRVRIVAPLPGRGAVGIEVPNETQEMVLLRELLAHPGFSDKKKQLPVALGKDIAGQPVFTDWAKMPHLLVAGTTGSGKSVAVNAVIISLLYSLPPEQLRLILVDPKMLEFTMYEGIPHLLVPVVTEPRKAAAALKWAVDEMEARYALLAEARCRNIVNYNQKVERLRRAEEANGRTLPDTRGGIVSEFGEDAPTDSEGRLLEPLAYCCIVIDEFADLMMVAAKEVQESVVRLAQKARAAGIHLLLATQRPSVDVITGLIKANFPSRISFRVSSRVDSRTVLDANGAEHLLGKGDMLFLAPGTSELKRVHGSFVNDEEAEAVAQFLKEQGSPRYVERILVDEKAQQSALEEEYDPLYDQALAIVAKAQKASTSMLQRHLKIGYNRAARIIERLEAEGCVGPGDGARPRKVLIPPAPED